MKVSSAHVELVDRPNLCDRAYFAFAALICKASASMSLELSFASKWGIRPFP